MTSPPHTWDISHTTAFCCRVGRPTDHHSGIVVAMVSHWHNSPPTTKLIGTMFTNLAIVCTKPTVNKNTWPAPRNALERGAAGALQQHVGTSLVSTLVGICSVVRNPWLKKKPGEVEKKWQPIEEWFLRGWECGFEASSWHGFHAQITCL